MNKLLRTLATLAMTLLGTTGTLTAQTPPQLSWASLIDSGTTVTDGTRVIRRMTNGDIIAASQTRGSGIDNIRITRHNGTTGAVMWTTDTSPGDNSDDTTSMEIDPATGDAFLACRISFPFNLNWYVIKVRGSDGGIDWTYNYSTSGNNNDEPRSICRTTDGNVVLAGMFTDPGTGAPFLRVVKLNASTGLEIWSYNHGASWSDAIQVVADTNGNALVSGIVGAGIEEHNGVILKFGPSSGTPLWNVTYDSGLNLLDNPGSIAVDSAGNAFVAFESRVTGTNDNIRVTKFAASNGLVQWSTVPAAGAFDGSDIPQIVRVDASDNVFVGGNVKNLSTSSQAFLAKINGSTGAMVWTVFKDATNTTSSLETFRDIGFNGSEVYAVATFSNVISATNQNDIYIGRFNSSDGSTVWEVNYNSSGTKADSISTRLGSSLLVTGTDAFYVCGASANPAATQTDGVILKYIPAGPVGPSAPTVTTDTQTAVTHNSATLGGNVTADGGASVTERGIVWSTSANPTTADNKVANGSGTGTFSGTVNGLPSNTPVHVRAYATNSVNTSYGADISFTTAAPPPTVTSVTSTTADGAYHATQSIDISVVFSAPVTVTGAPQITLETGVVDRTLAVTSGSGTNTLHFSYSVQSGDTSADLDYISTSALALAGGTINATSGGTPVVLTLPAPGAAGSLGANKNIVIDTTPPTVVSVTRLSPGAQNTNATTVTFRVTYSEPVTLTAPLTTHYQVMPVNGSTITGTVQSVTGADGTATRDVTVQITGGTGEFRLRVLD